MSRESCKTVRRWWRAAVRALALADADMLVERDFAGEGTERAAFDEGEAFGAECAFAVFGIESVEGFGEDELEDGVAQKFEPLVRAVVARSSPR